MAIAAAVFQLAMLDDLLPRFTKENMPALPPKPGAAPAPTPTPQTRN
jgi:hypothetical protein